MLRVILLLFSRYQSIKIIIIIIIINNKRRENTITIAIAIAITIEERRGGVGGEEEKSHQCSRRRKQNIKIKQGWELGLKSSLQGYIQSWPSTSPIRTFCSDLINEMPPRSHVRPSPSARGS